MMIHRKIILPRSGRDKSIVVKEIRPVGLEACQTPVDRYRALVAPRMGLKLGVYPPQHAS